MAQCNLYPSLCITLYLISHPSVPRTLITSPIPPPRPPSLLPPPTIKLLLPQLPINLVVRLAHPPPQPLPPFHPRLVPLFLNPGLEVLGADPAGIDFGEEREERAHFALLCGCGTGGVGGRDAVQEGPGVVSEGVNVRGAVGGKGRCC